jgi:hypothetical protein
MKTITIVLIISCVALFGRAGEPSWLQTGEFRWKASPALIGPDDKAAVPEVSLKDPTIVQVDGVWHLIATHRMADKKVNMQQLSFTDWKQAGTAKRYTLDLHDQYHCAPQVFYFTPHKKWYLIYQLADKNRKLNFGPFFSTSDTISDPTSWTKPQPLIAELPPGVERHKWLDFWVICDAEKAHLFYTCDDGSFWRWETTRDAFPSGWTKPVLVLKDTKMELFEAAHTYKLKGMQRYLTIIEAIGDRGRYYKAWLANKLEGPWEPLAATRAKAFASMDNVSQSPEWTTNISHGELIRSGYDELLEIDPANLRLVFQGANDDEYRGNRYGSIPWRIGVLEQVETKK